MSEYLLEVKDLRVHFPVGRGLGRNKKVLKAVDGVSFSLKEGETLGIVGDPAAESPPAATASSAF